MMAFLDAWRPLTACCMLAIAAIPLTSTFLKIEAEKRIFKRFEGAKLRAYRGLTAFQKHSSTAQSDSRWLYEAEHFRNGPQAPKRSYKGMVFFLEYRLGEAYAFTRFVLCLICVSPGMVAPTTINQYRDCETSSEPLHNVGNRLKRVREESRDHSDRPPSFDEGVSALKRRRGGESVTSLKDFSLEPESQAEVTTSSTTVDPADRCSQSTVTESYTPPPSLFDEASTTGGSPRLQSSQASTADRWSPARPSRREALMARIDFSKVPAWYAEVYESDGYDTDALEVLLPLSPAQCVSQTTSDLSSFGFAIISDSSLNSARADAKRRREEREERELADKREREQRDSDRRAEAALAEQRLQQQRLDEKLRREEEQRKEVAARAERDQERAEERRRHEERMELERAEARQRHEQMMILLSNMSGRKGLRIVVAT
ncbi:hypothetical protein GN244_ATG14945 [Phytophthora infestans]|uniref:Uncharacterized protein n=1 Tax=Phytophthora infestans TaxID=4787 RepID=A0A833SDX2_PHYIN|nr:hypothetical protein GN244_ATG14945 [Phytophthora infestans]